MEYNNKTILSEELFQIMLKDKKVRIAITKKSHKHFFHFYFAHYILYQTAPFHDEMFWLTENEDLGNFFITAFRGCGKSTIITTSFPIWAILGEQQKKFILIICQTQAQAKQHMMNLRQELESNTLLKNDLGPFKEESPEWGSTSLVFSNSGARITIASSEQSIRGLRHNQHRPDLIICDDVEDIASTKTRDGRNKTHQWLTSEVIPAGDKDTRLIIVGNLLHEDSLLMRLKEGIEKGNINGIFKEYPLVKDDKIMWPGKYPTLDDVENEKKKVGNEYAWQREFLLNIVPAEDQVIDLSWIKNYDELPSEIEAKKYNAFRRGNVEIGVDLAISEREIADFTAMVPIKIYGGHDNMLIYVLPGIINKRMNFPETVETCKRLNQIYNNRQTGLPKFIIEDVGYQKALPQQLKNEGMWDIETARPGNSDKRSRLMQTAHLIQTGRILFPKQGCEELINQIVHFGVEKHDDLADAFSMVILHAIEFPRPFIGFI